MTEVQNITTTTQKHTNQDYLNEKFLLEKRKLHLEYLEKLKNCQTDTEEEDAFLYHESRQKVDDWYEEQMLILTGKQVLKEKSEEFVDAITTAGNEIYQKIEPFVNTISNSLQEGIENFGVSETEKQWNHEARDVEYMEKLKGEIEKNELEKDLNEFKLKKHKNDDSIESNDTKSEKQ